MTAIFNDDRSHRYFLERVVDIMPGPTACLIGVNPSDANEESNDQTIRKDIGFARRLGWSRIWKLNKFSLVDKNVRALAKAPQPCDAWTDVHLSNAIRDADIVVPCWGPLAKLPPNLRFRWNVIVCLAENWRKPLFCFGTAKDGQPRHTLMLAYDTPLVPWTPPA